MNQSRTLINQIKRKKKKDQIRKRMAVVSVFFSLIIAGALIWYGYPLLHGWLQKESGTDLPQADNSIGLVSGPTSGKPAEEENPGQRPDEQNSSLTPNHPESEQNPSPGEEAGEAEDEVVLTFVGDVLLGNNVEPILKKNGYDYPYREVIQYLSSSDLTIANLETPITLRGEPQEGKEYVYRSSPEALPAFVEAGFDLVNLANNHVLDYSQVGLLDTFDHLDEAGVKWVGAGRDADEAYKPEFIEKNGIKIAFLGFSHVVPHELWKASKDHPGVAETYNYERPVEAIQSAKEEADLVIVIAHWGKEKEELPVKHQTEMARRYIHAGADLVIGGHPHVLQGFEKYNDKWIAYSLGNFIFTTNQNADTHQTIILNAVCSKQGDCRLSLVPIYTYYARPVVMEGDQAEQLRKKLTRISFDAVVNDDGTIEHVQR